MNTKILINNCISSFCFYFNNKSIKIVEKFDITEMEADHITP